MKRNQFLPSVAAVFIYLGVFSAIAGNTAGGQTKTVDLNKDGVRDITYYHDGQHITKVEADTNYDGNPDVVLYTEDGKFKSAEADTDYDGKMDREFSDVKEFNSWINKVNPEFADSLNRPDWEVALFNW